MFKAKLGTVFRYHADLHDEIIVQVHGEEAAAGANTVVCGDHVVSTIGVPAEDFLEFAAHVAGLPVWEPEKDAYDLETTELMVKHVADCLECSIDGRARCSKYWELILERVKAKEAEAEARKRVQ